MESKENCGICGSVLIYQTDAVPMECSFCHSQGNTNIFCPEGHYICDACHEQETLEMLKEAVLNSTSASPDEILETVMSHSSVPMHGPEHHAIVPAVIVAAVRNAGYPIPEKAIEKAIDRGSKVPGGWCGLYGACGAAIGVGVAVSVLGKATPLTGKPRSRAIKATSLALERMVDHHPRCCKRASRRAVEAAVDFLHREMSIDLKIGPAAECNYHQRNNECPRKGCFYYPVVTT